MVEKVSHMRSLWMAFAGLAVVGLAVGYSLLSLGRSVDFYVAPSELLSDEFSGKRTRLGGVVVPGTLRRTGVMIVFMAQDYSPTESSGSGASIMVEFSGRVPDLLREGEVMVAEGELDDSGVYQADKIMARHDENYVPPSVGND